MCCVGGLAASYTVGDMHGCSGSTLRFQLPAALHAQVAQHEPRTLRRGAAADVAGRAQAAAGTGAGAAPAAQPQRVCGLAAGSID